MERVFGNYVLRERIGAGGMGEVYRATKRGPEGFEAQVALKLILPHLAREESFRRMFSQEARLAALLRHPNIVQVNGFDILDGTPFIEMELVEGSDLASLLKTLDKGERLPLEEAAYLLHEAARGLAHAHSMRHDPGGGAGIIHRDFNPHNVLISVEGEIKVADFGIARAARAKEAATRTLMGKLAYMSPEQIEGRQLGHRSDLFSLGITAYQLFTGIHPFHRSGEAGTIRAVQEVSFKPVAETSPDLPAPVIRVIESLLAPDPRNRPETALAAVEVLEGYLKPSIPKKLGERIRGISQRESDFPTVHSTPVTLPAPTVWFSFRKFSLPIIAAAALILALGFWGVPDDREGLVGEPAEPAAGPSLPEPQPAPPPVLPEEVVMVSTSPPGARILSGTTILGPSPLKVTIPAGVPSLKLTALLDGYEASETSLGRDHSTGGISLPLKALPTGTLRVGAIPWARVTFMEKEVGMTPLVITDVPVGIHRTVFTNEELGVTREISLEVTKGDNPAFVLDLGTGNRIED